MAVVGGNDDPTAPGAGVKPQSPRSRMDPAALAAAEEADRIPVGRKWGPAWTLILVIAVPALFWALVVLVMGLR